MKTKPTIALIVMCIALSAFTSQQDIPKCYLSFLKGGGLTAMAPERLPESAEKIRKVKTDKGEADVSRVDGYRIKYLNGKGAEFANIKVELSDPKSYEADTANILANLRYLNTNTPGMESKDLVELDYNGYKIHGLGRNSLEKGATLGTFVIFPGNNITVYFYFNNLKPEDRNYADYNAYRGERNGFLGNYTYHLRSCK